MKTKTPTPYQRQRRRTFLYFYILLALSVLLVSASYTWFSLSQTPRVSDMALYINARTGVELSMNPHAPDEAWGQEIRFLDLVSEDVPLRPVTWSKKQQCFLTMGYGSDGRMTGELVPLTDEAHANRTDGEGYYAVGTFYVRTDESCIVSLAKAVEVNEGENGAGTYVIGAPVWSEETLLHYNGGRGAETAIRIGFLITKVYGMVQDEVTDPVFIVYEPNSDRHIDGSVGYVETLSSDGTGPLADNLICQTLSTWVEADPVQRQVTIKQLGAFTTDTKLLSINAGEMYQVKLYVWLEGQDVDCTNRIEDAKIIANIQFSTEYTGQGGLEEIPNE